ncbi:MAG: hypothetical protein J0M07_11130 [Anaerolineae bacterium]|nr:hypothetical protein [Anaerolineae bacterium]
MNSPAATYALRPQSSVLSPISPREWRYVALFTLIVIILLTAPYVVAWTSQTDQWRFGGSLFGVEDGNSYLGKMRLGARGLWDFYLFYTSEAHASAPLFYLPYIITGQIVGRFFDPTDPRLAPALMVAFRVLQVVCNALLIPVMYAFIAAFTRSIKTRRLALTLATFGGGIGWLLALTGNNGLLGSLPIDVYVPEGFSFLVLFGLPHIALGRAALLGMLLAMMKASADPTPQPLPEFGEGSQPIPPSPRLRGRGGQGVRGSLWLLLAIACGYVVALAVPFYLALAYVILGAWGLAAWLLNRRFPTRLFWRGVLVGLLTLPIVAYFAWQFVIIDELAVWSSQNDLPSPHPLHYVFGYALLALPAVVAVWRVMRMKPHPPSPSPGGEGEQSPLALGRGDLGVRLSLLLGWLLVVPILVYLPINVQRRMSEGVIVPLAILAAIGLRWMARRIRFGRALKYALTGAALMTSVFLLFGGFLAASNPGRPIFRPAEEIAAFDWLAAHAEPDAVILTAPETGNAIPVYTSLRTYMGHGPETLYWQQKTETLTRFYRGELTAAERAELFSVTTQDSAFALSYYRLAVRYVYFGERERALAGDSMAWADGLTLIYDVDGVQIYRSE